MTSRIRVLRPAELTEADRAAWTGLQSRAWVCGSPALASPFLSPEFTLAVDRFRRGVRVAVVYEDGEPAAFFPFQRTVLGVGRAVGLGLSDCQGLVHRPGFQWEARELLRACRLAIWEFDHLVEGEKPFEVGATGSFPSPVIDVEQGYEAYLGYLRSHAPKFVRTTLAKERKLERDAGGLRYVHDERDPAALRTLMGWKSAQYRRTGRSDRFARPWIVRLVEHLFNVRGEDFAGQLSVLYAGGRPVAAHFGLRSDRVVACWFPAYDTAFGKYSPGLTLHLRMAEAAAANGISYLDLGRGEKEYKESLKTRELSVSEGWVTRRHPVAIGHLVRRAPVRAARNAVLARPQLLGRADQLLRLLGRLRTER
ncbi:GNAT family N-acetyltransferase [Streptomyces silvisoli]|uniref:GNAT family N-acetyltransferase n=1 Tax=Streptomyces silvisoli TaxID=3034235 RepID=A0ABT5ZKQ3_9ACTN|nr:GNAT family N-acetyltransferase [Streptomyces silvisoli]MDF3290403.1 GNAT family N-acetyltransferase [Streptomyces silvisoli]